MSAPADPAAMPLTLDHGRVQLVGPAGRVDLTVVEYRLLSALLRQPGRAVAHSTLCDAAGTTVAALRPHISRLRAKIALVAPEASRQFLQAWHARGYRLGGSGGLLASTVPPDEERALLVADEADALPAHPSMVADEPSAIVFGARRRLHEAEQAIAALRAYHTPRGWANDDGELAVQALVNLQALGAYVDVLLRRWR